MHADVTTTASTAPERVIYIARRRPDTDHAEFVRRWREHWDVVGARPEIEAIRRYTQCEILVDSDPVPRDGIAISEYRSPEARRSLRTATEFRRIAQQDELRVFDRLVGEQLFIATHHVLAGVARGPFKVMRFLTRRPELSPDGFRAAWTDRAHVDRVVAAAGPDLLGYAQNRPIEPDQPTGWSLAVDGAEEFWFGDLATAQAVFADRRLDAVDADLVGSVDAVVTDEIQLWAAP